MKKYPSKLKMTIYHLKSLVFCLILLLCTVILFWYSARYGELISNWEEERESYFGKCSSIVTSEITSRYRNRYTIFIFDSGLEMGGISSVLKDAGLENFGRDYFTSKELLFYYMPFSNNPFTARTTLLGIEEDGVALLDEEVIIKKIKENRGLSIVCGILGLLFATMSGAYFFFISIHHIFPNLKPRWRKLKKRVRKKIKEYKQ